MHSEPQIERQIEQASSQRPWRAFGLVVLVLAAVLAVFWPTLRSMAEIWNRSETFTHGWLVIPAFVWFAWERRQRLGAIELQPFWPGLVLVAGGGFAWLAANAAGVGVIEQLAMIGLVAACILTVFGWRFGRELAFPLAFMFFAVPMGEALIPAMMETTADFTVGALRLSGIPVYREGLFFVIPSGSWAIVEACSGLRYLIASVTVGCVFAYLYYRSLGRRLAFIGASIIVPIVANWLRAYIIVMMGHLSGNRLAAGADHLVYGWLFFGFVMLLLFWVGARWREDDPPPKTDRRVNSAGPALTDAGWQRISAAAMLSLLLLAAGPAWAMFLAHRAEADSRVLRLIPPDGIGGWQRESEQLTDWRPRYVGAKASIFETYSKGGARVALYLAAYRNQKQDAELINSQNLMVAQKDPKWANIGETVRALTIGEATMPLRQSLLRGAAQRLLVWDWFVISGRDVANPYLAKLLQARDELLGKGDDGIAFVVAAPYEVDPESAEKVLRDFVFTMRGPIDTSIAAALGR